MMVLAEFRYILAGIVYLVSFFWRNVIGLSVGLGCGVIDIGNAGNGLCRLILLVFWSNYGKWKTDGLMHGFLSCLECAEI